MKKVCYLINSDWYFELHWVERALAAKDAGYEVHVICHYEGDEIKSRLEKHGFICHNSLISAQSYNPVGFILTFTRIWKMLNQLDPDVLHCVTIKSFLAGGIYAKFKSKPIILSFAGLGRVFDNGKMLINALRFFVLSTYKYIAKNPRAVLVFEHESDQERLISLTGINKLQTRVIDGAGINTDDYPYTSEPIQVPPVVLFASRMLWSKGLHDLISVKKSLANADIHFTLNVAGILSTEDADAIPLSMLEQWHKEGVINWLGRSNNVSQLIAAANIVALPSTYSEGVPRILLEAASMGRACLAYDVGGCKSIVQDGANGFLVAKKDVAVLELQLKKLLQDATLRHKMGLLGRELALRKFSSAQVIVKTLSLYEGM